MRLLGVSVKVNEQKNGPHSPPLRPLARLSTRGYRIIRGVYTRNPTQASSRAAYPFNSLVRTGKSHPVAAPGRRYPRDWHTSGEMQGAALAQRSAVGVQASSSRVRFNQPVLNASGERSLCCSPIHQSFREE